MILKQFFKNFVIKSQTFLILKLSKIPDLKILKSQFKEIYQKHLSVSIV